MINRAGFTREDRTPNPELLLRAYERSGLTINFIRSLIEGGFADLHHPEYWELGFVANIAARGRIHAHGRDHRRVAAFHGDAYRERAGGHQPRGFLHQPRGAARSITSRPKLGRCRAAPAGITSRRTSPGSATARARSTARTSSISAGIANPIGVKIGPAVTPDEALALAGALNPQNEPGRLTFIHRFGADRVEKCLPPLAKAIRRGGQQVLWCCDPMHGNTETTKSGIKTRRFDKILRELETSCQILKDCGSHLGGVHFELTGDNVTECIGGASGVTEADLTRDYRTTLDPRLNYEQAMEMALLLARLLAQSRK